MTWWVPIPDALNRDPRARVVSRAARGVLAQLLVEARGGDGVPYVNHHDGRGTCAVIAWCEGDGEGACGGEVQELVDAGLLVLDDVERVLRLGLTASGPPRPALAQTPSAPAPSARRVKPSDTPERVRARKARHALKVEFEARTGECVTAPGGLTWEAWLATEAGAALYLARVGTPHRNAPERPTGTPRNAPENAPPERPWNAPGTPPLPHTPSPEENTEKHRETTDSGARDCVPGTPPGTPPQNAPRGGVPGAFQNAPQNADLPEGGVRCGTEERLVGAVDPEAALFEVRSRAKGSRINLAHDTRSLSQWSGVVRELVAAGAVKGPEPFHVLGDWIGAGGLGWWSQGRPSLAYLLRPGQLATHLEDAAQWDAGGRGPIRHGERAPARAAPPRRHGAAPVSAAFAPVDDPEMMAIFNLEQRKATARR